MDDHQLRDINAARLSMHEVTKVLHRTVPGLQMRPRHLSAPSSSCKRWDSLCSYTGHP